jgi:AraC-like DNA-binding protein
MYKASLVVYRANGCTLREALRAVYLLLICECRCLYHTNMSEYVDMPDANPEVHLLQCGYVALRHWTHPSLSDWFWRIYWNASSGASVVCGQREYPLEPSRLTVIPPNTLFVPRTSRPAHQLFVHFSISADIRVKTAGIFQWPADRHDLAILKHLTNRVADQWPVRFRRDLAFYELILKTLRRMPPKIWQRITHDPRVGSVVKTLRSHTGKPLTNDQLARDVRMSTNGFIRLFHGATGVSPQRFQLMLRLEKAGSDLLHGWNSIDAIAERHGFCDRAHFTKAFRRHYPVGPAEYRKQHVDLSERIDTPHVR